MQKYFNSVADKHGNPVHGAVVRVTTFPAGAAATIYSDNGVTPIVGDLETDGNGAFAFYAADGRYTLTVSNFGVTTSVIDILLEDPVDGSSALASPTGSGLIGWIQSGAGAIARFVLGKLLEMRKSPKDFGAKGDGVTNDTASFALTRTASGGAYHISNGTYVLDASPDPFLDNFTSGDNVTLIVGGVTYTISNAVSGPTRIVRLSATLAALLDSVTGNTVVAWQNAAPGTAIYLYRGVAFRTDSHAIQMQPLTLGGAIDILFQRSAAHADAGGNRANITYEEGADRVLFSVATTPSGSPSFDSLIQLFAGALARLVFPLAKAECNLGVEILPRSGGTFGTRQEPITSSTQRITDPISGTILCDISLANGYVFRNLAWSNPTYGKGTFDYITNGVAIAIDGTANFAIFQNGAESWRFDTTRAFRPATDNAYSLGTASFRTSVVYSATAAINTSDERAKVEMEPIPQSWLDAWGEVEFMRFKYRDAMSEKGDGARWHVGVIAQRVKEAFERHGIDPFEIGLLCWDEWEDQYTDDMVKTIEKATRKIEHVEFVIATREVQKDGATVIEEYLKDVHTFVDTEVEEEKITPVPRLIKKAGNQYGIRYEEALCLQCAYLQSLIVKKTQ